MVQPHLLGREDGLRRGIRAGLFVVVVVVVVIGLPGSMLSVACVLGGTETAMVLLIVVMAVVQLRRCGGQIERRQRRRRTKRISGKAVHAIAVMVVVVVVRLRARAVDVDVHGARCFLGRRGLRGVRFRFGRRMRRCGANGGR